jgi:hypothetical protein
MVFWIAILVGVLFVWLAVRMGFYETWALLFNIVVSIYVAVFLAPLVAQLAPASGEASAYSMALSMVLLGGGCFAILHGLSYVFLTGQFSVRFPRFFDILLAGALGFVAGFLILSFAALIITTTPLARHKLVNSVGFSRQAQRSNIACIAWCCDLVHAVARFESNENTAQAAVEHLLEEAEEISSPGNLPHADSNETAVTGSPPRTPRPGRARDPVDDMEKL